MSYERSGVDTCTRNIQKTGVMADENTGVMADESVKESSDIC
jgi:hypothetical protein